MPFKARRKRGGESYKNVDNVHNKIKLGIGRGGGSGWLQGFRQNSIDTIDKRLQLKIYN